jgi:hypothetical protein
LNSKTFNHPFDHHRECFAARIDTSAAARTKEEVWITALSTKAGSKGGDKTATTSEISGQPSPAPAGGKLARKPMMAIKVLTKEAAKKRRCVSHLFHSRHD